MKIKPYVSASILESIQRMTKSPLIESIPSLIIGSSRPEAGTWLSPGATSPPELYDTRCRGTDAPIRIDGRFINHLDIYSWYREIAWVDTLVGGCMLCQPKITYRVVAKPKSFSEGTYIITSAIVSRIWKIIQTDGGMVYTLGTETDLSDPRLNIALTNEIFA
jgi:hypothetical protein